VHLDRLIMRISVKITVGVCVIAALVAAVGFLTNVTDQDIQAFAGRLPRIGGAGGRHGAV
jgi:hypothetical protein